MGCFYIWAQNAIKKNINYLTCEWLCCQAVQALKLSYNNPLTSQSKFYPGISSLEPETSFRTCFRVSNDVFSHGGEVPAKTRVGFILL